MVTFSCHVVLIATNITGLDLAGKLASGAVMHLTSLFRSELYLCILPESSSQVSCLVVIFFLV